MAMGHVKEEAALYQGRAEETEPRRGIASRYISEGEKARPDSSLCTELRGEGRKLRGDDDGGLGSLPGK